MALMGMTVPTAPLTVEQRGTESLSFVWGQVLGLLADKLLAFNLFGAAGNLVSSLLLCHYRTSCTVFIPYDIQTPALIRMLPILWGQRYCKA